MSYNHFGHQFNVELITAEYFNLRANLLLMYFFNLSFSV